MNTNPHLHEALKQGQLELRWFSPDGVAPILGLEPRTNHTKLMLIDREIAIVGSGNLDHQSYYHSFELNLLLDNLEASEAIRTRLFEKQWSKSIPINIPSIYTTPSIDMGSCFIIIFIFILLGLYYTHHQQTNKKYK